MEHVKFCIMFYRSKDRVMACLLPLFWFCVGVCFFFFNQHLPLKITFILDFFLRHSNFNNKKVSSLAAASINNNVA